MRISKLKIEGFRSLRDVEIPLSNYTILIGRNNSGKSSVLLALKLLFEGTLRDIADIDFHVRGTQPDEQIIIQAVLEGIEEYLSLCSEPHRSKISECITEDGKLRIRRKASRFPLALGKLELWQPTKEQWGLPTGIENALKQLLPEIIFIEAFKDPSEEAQAKSSAAFGKILKQIVEPVSSQLEADVRSSLDQVNRRFNVVEMEDTKVDERPEELKRVEQRIRQHLQAVFEEADFRLKFRLPEVRDLIGLATVELRDRGVWTPLEGKGQGFQRMLYLALLRTLAEELRETKEKPRETQEELQETEEEPREAKNDIHRPFLLLFEEPEAFLHPSLQREVGDILESISMSNQVVIATHSPLVVTPQRVQNVLILRQTRVDNADFYATRCFVPDTEQLPNPDDKQLISLLKFSNSAEFLFADHVLVVEGPSDRTLLEACWSVLRKTSRAIQTPPVELGIVEAGNKQVVPVWIKHLHAIGLPSRGVVDLDFLWDGAGKCLGDDTDLSQFTEKFWNLAEKNGLSERNNGGNRHIKPNKKADAFAMIQSDLNQLAQALRQRLREAGIWVLERGEIESYFGLSNRSKGDYTSVSHQIRKGEMRIPEEIENVLKWGAGLQDNCAE